MSNRAWEAVAEFMLTLIVGIPLAIAVPFATVFVMVLLGILP